MRKFVRVVSAEIILSVEVLVWPGQCRRYFWAWAVETDCRCEIIVTKCGDIYVYTVASKKVKTVDMSDGKELVFSTLTTDSIKL
jgi:hypothetical protein